MCLPSEQKSRVVCMPFSLMRITAECLCLASVSDRGDGTAHLCSTSFCELWYMASATHRSVYYVLLCGAYKHADAALRLSVILIRLVLSNAFFRFQIGCMLHVYDCVDTLYPVAMTAKGRVTFVCVCV